MLAAAVWYQVALLDLPIYRDIGAYLTIAQEILDGEIPYRDVIDHKPPGVYYVLGAILAMGGDAATAKAIVVGVNLGIVGLLVLVARELWDAFAGLYAGAAYLLVTPLYGGFKFQSEHSSRCSR